MKTRRLCRSITFILLLFFAVFTYGCSDEVADNPYHTYLLETDHERIDFDAEGGDRVLRLTTNAAWQINTSSDWVSFTPAQGEEPAAQRQITVTVGPNSDYRDISTTISVKCGDIATDFVVRKFITIYQKGMERPDLGPGIHSRADLVAFGQAITGDQDYSLWQDEDGVINLMADIDFGSDPIPCMGGQSSGNTFAGDDDKAFGGRFNGNGYTIKGTLDGGNKRIVALFTRLEPTGIIENLNVDIHGTSTWTESNGHLSGLVGFTVTSTGGFIKNCTVRGSLIHTGAASTRVGGVVAYGRTDIEECENYADIQARANRVAGISGAGGGNFRITDCINHGNLSTDAPSAQIGGIIGQLNGQMVTGCVNNGKITAAANAATALGGIAGDGRGNSAIGGAADHEKCINNGEVSLIPSSADPENAAAGGIAGNINTATVPLTHVVNTALVHSTVASDKVSAGGIIGQFSNASSVSRAENSASAEVIAACNAGGIVGRSIAAASITDCSHQGAVSALPGASIPAAGSYIGGIIGQPGAAVLTGCTNTGTVKGQPGNDTNALGHP